MQNLIINTERLQIRYLKMTDLEDFHFYRSNPDITKYQGFDVFTIEQAESFIKSQLDKKFGKAGEFIQYAIENKATGKLIGDCMIKLNQHDVRIANTGMTISHTAQKQGYAKEAGIGILNFLFNIDNFHRVKTIVFAENVASINLVKSIGFRQEGHFIENIFFNEKWISEYHYAILKREWELMNKRKTQKEV